MHSAFNTLFMALPCMFQRSQPVLIVEMILGIREGFSTDSMCCCMITTTHHGGPLAGEIVDLVGPDPWGSVQENQRALPRAPLSEAEHEHQSRLSARHRRPVEVARTRIIGLPCIAISSLRWLQLVISGPLPGWAFPARQHLLHRPDSTTQTKHYLKISFLLFGILA